MAAAQAPPPPRFARRLGRALVSRYALGVLVLGTAWAFLLGPTHPVFDAVLGAAVWLFVGWCVASKESGWARRRREQGLRRELGWATGAPRGLLGDSFKLGLLFWGALTLAFAIGWQMAARDASRIRHLPPCTSGRTSGCLATRHGLLLARKGSGGSALSLVVAFRDGVRTVDLNDHGGAGWGGHFPVGERVTVLYHGSTPLRVTEPDGHSQQSAYDLGGLAAALKFMTISSAAIMLPFALFFRRRQRRRERFLLRVATPERPA